MQVEYRLYLQYIGKFADNGDATWDSDWANEMQTRAMASIVT